jgi:hypothetical protein
MRKTIVFLKNLFFLILLPATLSAQTIEVRLPYYAARDYYFCLLKGARQDTVATGVLDDYGRATIDLSGKYPAYRGVGRFSVKEYGKLWNIVINGNEKIVMSEPEKQEAETSFENSPENTFLINSFARQGKIISDYNEAANSPQSQSFVLTSPEQHMQRIENEYKAFGKEVKDSPLYAARIMEILSCLIGDSSFDISQDDMLKEQREFVVHKVNFNDLYTSGFWQPAIELWFQTTSLNEQTNDSLLLSDSRYMLNRCDNIPVRRELTQTIIRLFSKYGKDSLLAELGTEYLTMPLNGQLAPQIATAEGFFLPQNSLIIFYETGCGNCHYELEKLKGKYRLLTDNHIRVISIAADTDQDVFEETAHALPWTDKICDFKSFAGDNFKNYGIVGTPTYILTDAEGIVRGRYAQLKELLNE